MEKVIPKLDDATFAEAMQPILKEYLEHGDTTEVKVSHLDDDDDDIIVIVECAQLY